MYDCFIAYEGVHCVCLDMAVAGSHTPGTYLVAGVTTAPERLHSIIPTAQSLSL
jgi:hypothetical protein